MQWSEDGFIKVETVIPRHNYSYKIFLKYITIFFLSKNHKNAANYFLTPFIHYSKQYIPNNTNLDERLITNDVT